MQQMLTTKQGYSKALKEVFTRKPRKNSFSSSVQHRKDVMTKNMEKES